MRATRNSGVDVDITMTVESIDKKQSISDLILEGIESSVASMSLVNRLTMRPNGVVSKNSMWALNTELRSLLCIILVAFMNMATKQTLPKNDISALSLKVVTYWSIFWGEFKRSCTFRKPEEGVYCQTEIF